MAAAAETLQTPEKQQLVEEQNKSFDVLASVHMMQHDIRRHGLVLPETKQRVYDEELTYIAEGINRPLYSSFSIQEHNGVLSYFNQGEWRPYIGMLITGQQTARDEAKQDHRKHFLAEQAVTDLAMGYEMQQLAPGEALVWDSPFPEAECQRYGEQFMTQHGFQSRRRMGFIYRAQKHADGSLTLETHSVDNSDVAGFSNVAATVAHDPNADMETLVRSYDGALKVKDGQDYRAGRLVGDKIEEEACAFIESHKPVFSYYLDQIEALAYSTQSSPELETAKKRLTYGTWAYIKELLDSEQISHALASVGVSQAPPSDHYLAIRLEEAYRSASQRGDVMAGCGGAVSGDSLLDMSASDVFDLLFGKKNETDTKYKFDKEMHCVMCQAPPKEGAGKKMCGPCGLCKGCDSKFPK